MLDEPLLGEPTALARSALVEAAKPITGAATVAAAPVTRLFAYMAWQTGSAGNPQLGIPSRRHIPRGEGGQEMPARRCTQAPSPPQSPHSSRVARRATDAASRRRSRQDSRQAASSRRRSDVRRRPSDRAMARGAEVFGGLLAGAAVRRLTETQPYLLHRAACDISDDRPVYHTANQSVYDRPSSRRLCGEEDDRRGTLQDEEEPPEPQYKRTRDHPHMPRTSSKAPNHRRRSTRASMVDTQPARTALLAVARARPGDPRLLHARTPGAGDRRHRRRVGDEPLDDAPLRDHAGRPRLSRAGRLAQVPPRAARDRPGDGRRSARPGWASTPSPTSRSCANAASCSGRARGARRPGDLVRRSRAQPPSRPRGR